MSSAREKRDSGEPGARVEAGPGPATSLPAPALPSDAASGRREAVGAAEGQRSLDEPPRALLSTPLEPCDCAGMRGVTPLAGCPSFMRYVLTWSTLANATGRVWTQFALREQQRRDYLWGFTEGDRVLRFGGRGRWLPGRISRVNADDTYDVAYASGDREGGVRASLIRRAKDGESYTTSGMWSDMIEQVQKRGGLVTSEFFDRVLPVILRAARGSADSRAYLANFNIVNPMCSGSLVSARWEDVRPGFRRTARQYYDDLAWQEPQELLRSDGVTTVRRTAAEAFAQGDLVLVPLNEPGHWVLAGIRLVNSPLAHRGAGGASAVAADPGEAMRVEIVFLNSMWHAAGAAIAPRFHYCMLECAAALVRGAHRVMVRAGVDAVQPSVCTRVYTISRAQACQRGAGADAGAICGIVVAAWIEAVMRGMDPDAFLGPVDAALPGLGPLTTANLGRIPFPERTGADVLRAYYTMRVAQALSAAYAEDRARRVVRKKADGGGGGGGGGGGVQQLLAAGVLSVSPSLQPLKVAYRKLVASVLPRLTDLRKQMEEVDRELVSTDAEAVRVASALEQMRMQRPTSTTTTTQHEHGEEEARLQALQKLVTDLVDRRQRVYAQYNRIASVYAAVAAPLEIPVDGDESMELVDALLHGPVVRAPLMIGQSESRQAARAAAVRAVDDFWRIPALSRTDDARTSLLDTTATSGMAFNLIVPREGDSAWLPRISSAIRVAGIAADKRRRELGLLSRDTQTPVVPLSQREVERMRVEMAAKASEIAERELAAARRKKAEKGGRRRARRDLPAGAGYAAAEAPAPARAVAATEAQRAATPSERGQGSVSGAQRSSRPPLQTYSPSREAPPRAPTQRRQPVQSTRERYLRRLSAAASASAAGAAPAPLGSAAEASPWSEVNEYADIERMVDDMLGTAQRRTRRPPAPSRRSMALRQSMLRDILSEPDEGGSRSRRGAAAGASSGTDAATKMKAVEMLKGFGFAAPKAERMVSTVVLERGGRVITTPEEIVNLALDKAE